jgi:phosphate transport system substrate-binding protein
MFFPGIVARRSRSRKVSVGSWYTLAPAVLLCCILFLGTGSWYTLAPAVLLCCILFFGTAGSAWGEVEVLNGAGASFPYPIYAKWGSKYYQQSGLKLNYQSIGSGGGITQIKARTVDFGASDEPLKSEDLDKEGLTQFPMIMGGVVPVVNLPDLGKGKLKLTAELLAQICMGEIKKWNDRRIMAVNPDTNLPDLDITLVHRADGSGTTWIFTNYLTKVSKEWREKIGCNKSVSWPTGVGGKGNEGVAALVKKTSGSVGYVEFAYALKERLKYVQLQNKSGRFVQPNSQTFQAAATNADWNSAPNFLISLTDQPGDKSWPIVGVSYILVPRDQKDPAKAKAMLQFFDWCLKSGGWLANELHYVPLPQNLYQKIKNAWSQEISAEGKPVALKDN